MIYMICHINIERRTTAISWDLMGSLLAWHCGLISNFPKCYIFSFCVIMLSYQHSTLSVSLCRDLCTNELPSWQQLNMRDPILVTSFAGLGESSKAYIVSKWQKCGYSLHSFTLNQEVLSASACSIRCLLGLSWEPAWGGSDSLSWEREMTESSDSLSCWLFLSSNVWSRLMLTAIEESRAKAEGKAW